LQKRVEQGAFAQRTAGELGAANDGKSDGEIVAKFGRNRVAVDGRPGFRLVVEKAELNGQG
jgi:hypothetical protein